MARAYLNSPFMEPCPMQRCLIGLLAALLAGPARGEGPAVPSPLQPAPVILKGPGAVYSLLIDGKSAAGRLLDLTRSASFRSRADKVATVTETGVVRATGDGSTMID